MPNRQQSHREGAGHDTPDLRIIECVVKQVAPFAPMPPGLQ
jgi:hypothetical protein